MRRFLLIGCAVLALSACSRRGPDQAVEDHALNDIIQNEVNAAAVTSEVPLADAENVSNSAEPEVVSESPDDGEVFEYTNLDSQRGVYILRDKQTGCEFVQNDESTFPRPSGKTLSGLPLQRGCGTGTDFKEPQKPQG